MNPTIQDRRQPLPSIVTVYRPIEEYWESSRPAGGPGPEPSEALDPFDAFLVHRLLDLVPRPPILVDAALVPTHGASSLIGLGHPRVRAVWAVTDPGSPPARRVLAAVRGHVRARGHDLAPLKAKAHSELPAGLAEQPGATILTHARAGDGASLAEQVDHWLDAQPEALVLVLGLGRVGDCPAIASLVSHCTPESGKRLRLLRELSEVLMASRLGLIARHDHPHVEDMLLRLQQCYTGNYRYLDLLREVNLAALREARIDADAMRNHPFSWALTVEIDEAKRAAWEAQVALQAAREQLAAVPPVIPRFLVAMRRRLSPTPVATIWRRLRQVRGQLSPMPVATIWRQVKQVRSQLSPTPVGRTYRYGKRVVRAGLTRGRAWARGQGLSGGGQRGGGVTPSHPAGVPAPAHPVTPQAPPDAGGPVRSTNQASRPLAADSGPSTPPAQVALDSGGRGDRIVESGLPRLERLLPLLACPTCRTPVRLQGRALECDGCEARFALHAGRPAFLPGGTAPRIMPVEHLSNEPPRELLDWMTRFNGWILNIGAGGTHVKLENVVEMEYSLFRHTDVAADAHHLPFADGSFDAVVSFNTFEHLSDPERAAAEIFRVLKPGGRLVVHTAFLQPVHEPPHHYYNTTEYGLRRWFRAFEIAGVSVSENFNPAYVIAWLVTDLLRAIEATHGTQARDQLAASSLEFWRAGWEDPARREHPLWDLMRALPQEHQMRYAAGFQLDARKPQEAKSTAA